MKMAKAKKKRESVQHVLDHAPKTKSFVTKLNGSSKFEVVTLENDEAKEEWVDSLEEGDTLHTIFGVSDLIALAVFDRGVGVRRIPFYHITGRGKSRQFSIRDKDKSILPDLVKLVQEQPELFYQFRPLDQQVARVRALTRAFYMVQEKMRKPTQLRFQSAYREVYLTSEVRDELKEEQFIKQELAKSPVFSAFTEEEASWLRQIKTALRGIAIWDDVLKGTAARGIGPALGGVLIGEIGDINRFPHRDALVHYCGCHVTEAPEGLREQGVEGEMARRRKGEMALWNPRIRQALWKWSSTQVPKMSTQEKFACDPWVLMYHARRQLEIEKREAKGIPEEGVLMTLPGKNEGGKQKSRRYFSKGHLQNRVGAYLRTRFIRWLYKEWRQLAEAGRM